MLPFVPVGTPGNWLEIPGIGWINIDFPSFGGDMTASMRILLNEAARNLAEQAEIMIVLVEEGLLPFTQEVEYAVAVCADEVGITEMGFWQKLSWWIYDLKLKFEKLLNAIHFKTILAIHQVAMLVSPQYRAMMQRIFHSLSEYSKAIGMGPAFIDLAIRSTRTLVLDASSSLGHSYDMGQITWLMEMDGFLKTLAANTKRYADNPFLIFTDLEEDIERRYSNVHGNFELGVLNTIDSLIVGIGKAAGDIEKIDQDALKLLNDLPTMIKSRIDPEILKTMQAIDGFIAGEFLPKIGAINGVITQYGNDIRAAAAAASAAAARILTPKQTVMSLRDLPVIEQDEVLAGLDALDNRRTADMLLKITQWHRPVNDEFERLLQLPEPAKAPPVFLTLEHTLASVPDLQAPVSVSGPFVGDY